MSATGLIPRQRLRWIPKHLRYAHEYSFFLHDEVVRMLTEYEAAKAHLVTVRFRSKVQAARFAEMAKTDRVGALAATGYPKQARRVILNAVTMAMVSDCMHHLYEALRCLEKRKVVVAMNLMRKPFLDSLPYLSWMLADEDQFYQAFTAESPHGITQKRLGNIRREVITKALSKSGAGESLDPDFLLAVLFDPSHSLSLYKLFQHAVHLVTVEKLELRTEPSNFNFIFKNYSDDDLYEHVYGVLPSLLFYLHSVITELFQRMKRMDKGSKDSAATRATIGLYLANVSDSAGLAEPYLAKLSRKVRCESCASPIKITHHNATRAVIANTLRCTKCGSVSLFPFAWLI